MHLPRPPRWSRTRVLTWLVLLLAAGSVGALGAGVATHAAGAAQMRQARANASTWAGATDLTQLQLGDGRVSTSGPQRGWVFACFLPGGRPDPAANVVKPWIHGSTWNYYEKAKVIGGARWVSSLRITRSGNSRVLRGNGVPSHPTGHFPIMRSDPAARFDPNPNPIRPVDIHVPLPVSPTPSPTPNCVPQGPIGIMLSGALLFNALDANGKDAPAREIQDGCSGHPQEQGMYHYHALPTCIDSGPPGRPSDIIGWAVDGYPITGPRGPKGVTYTNAMLDECHGTTGPVRMAGKWRWTYHYVATMDFPYTIGCLRGKSVLAPSPAPGGGDGAPHKGAAPPQGAPSGGGTGAPGGPPRPTDAPFDFRGWLVLEVLQGSSSAAGYRWTGTSWSAVPVRPGWVYVAPYSGPWRLVWTQSTGWVVVGAARFRMP